MLDATCVPQRLRRPDRRGRPRSPTRAATGPTTSRTRGRRASSSAARLAGTRAAGSRRARRLHVPRHRDPRRRRRSERRPPPFTVGDPLLRRPRHQGVARRRLGARPRSPVFAQGGGRGHDARRRAELRHLRRAVRRRPATRSSNAGRRRAACTRHVEVYGARHEPVRSRVRGSPRLPCARAARLRRGARCCRPMTSRSRTDRGTARPAPPRARRRRPSPSPRGGIVGILGPNGSGKTTLLGCSPACCRRQRARCMLDGATAGALSARATLARRIAVVPQETHSRSTTPCSRWC